MQQRIWEFLQQKKINSEFNKPMQAHTVRNYIP